MGLFWNICAILCWAHLYQEAKNEEHRIEQIFTGLMLLGMIYALALRVYLAWKGGWN